MRTAVSRQRLRLSVAGAQCIALTLFAGAASDCSRRQSAGEPVPGAASSESDDTTWSAWLTLDPVLDVVRTHADDATRDRLEAARDTMQAGQYRSAAKSLLNTSSDESGLHWSTIARANLAAIHFTSCIRGTHWRLPEGEDGLHERRIIMDEATATQADDVLVEDLLTALDLAVKAEIPALVLHAHIARARVAAFAAQCPANAQVAARAEAVLMADLAQLAAEGQLAPDLAHMWGLVQLQKFSPAAARPFLRQALAGGFDDPSVVYLLAGIALELGEFERAGALAEQSELRYTELEQSSLAAESRRLRGESQRRRGQLELARASFEAALKLDATTVSAHLGLTRLDLESHGEQTAIEGLHARLPRILGSGPIEGDSARTLTVRLETLLLASEGELAGVRGPQLRTEPDIALESVLRAALLRGIDDEPFALRRGIRYYFAALLDLRLADPEAARGHAVTAELEFSDTPAPPVDVRAFLEHVERYRVQ